MAAPTAELLRYLYPNLYPVSDREGEWGRPTATGRYNTLLQLLQTVFEVVWRVCTMFWQIELKDALTRLRIKS